MKIFALIFFALFFVGCTASSFVKVDSKYRDQDFRSKRIFIMPVTKEVINILDTASVKESFKDDRLEPETIISDLTNKSAVENTKKSILGINVFEADSCKNYNISKSYCSNYILITKEKKDTLSYRFKIPQKEILDSNEVDADVVLVISNINFDSEMKKGFGGGISYKPGSTISTPGGTFSTPGTWSGGGFSSALVKAKVDFIIYDYNSNDAISYGTTKIEGYSGNIKGAIYNLTEKIAQVIFLHSPFQWRR